MKDRITQLKEEIIRYHVRIMDDFGKAYLSAKFKEGKDIDWLVKNISLVEKPTYGGGREYYFKLKEN